MELKRLLVLFSIIAILLFAFGCPDDDDDDDNNSNDDDSAMYEASGAVDSNGELLLETESGAKLAIPRYAVPLTIEEETGTMVFSIERDLSISPVLDEGASSASDVYRFGPDGFVFASPVRVTIPIDNFDESKEYEIYRINQTTGEAEVYSSFIDEENATISAYTYHLSPWAISEREYRERSGGAVRISNTSSTHALHVSVADFVPAYPMADTVTCSLYDAYFPALGSGSFVASSGLWHLPQGTYTLCFRMSEQGTFMNPPGDPVRWYEHDVIIDQPWSRTSPNISDEFSYGRPSDDAVDGFCDCRPEPTPSAGTGDVQVTLTWHNSDPIDLDLWIIEPDSTVCNYATTPTASGGTLDRDNLCGSTYINGRPENIFWSSAPEGTYRVQVDWFSDCGNGMSSQGYDVRIVNGSDVRTFSGTIQAEETIDIATFTVSRPSLAKSSGNSIFYIGQKTERIAERPPKY
ncbi:MAG: hypothetical protein ACLFSQ_03210 [Candidatus Zixiibacteriota bacterium]